jgi:hypothetical protein
MGLWPDSEPTKLPHHPKQMTSTDDIKGLVSLSSFAHDVYTSGLHVIEFNVQFCLSDIGIVYKGLVRSLE